MHIGVVVPAYNAAAWLGDAIGSVLAQTYREWSLLVVDDGSTDGTPDLAVSFRDSRIRLIRQANAGVSVARNRGFLELFGAAPAQNPEVRRREGVGGNGPAVLFLDADDELAPDALSRLAAALDAAPGAPAASGPYVFTGSCRVRTPPSGAILERLLVRNLFANGGHLLVRCEAVCAAGGFIPGIAYGEDWEFFVRLALLGRFAAVRSPAPVLFVRRHASGACQRLAAHPAAFQPCMSAIFGNPMLLARLGSHRLAAIRLQTEAENAWIVGRELIRHGRIGEGRTWLRRSVAARPTAKRAALLAAAEILPMLPPMLRGPFLPYPGSAAA